MYPPLGTSFPLGQCCECMVRDVPLWGGEHTSPNPGGHTPPRAPALPSRIYRPPLQGATPPSVVSVAGARALLCSYMASFFGPTMVHGLLVSVWVGCGAAVVQGPWSFKCVRYTDGARRQKSTKVGAFAEISSGAMHSIMSKDARFAPLLFLLGPPWPCAHD